MNDFFFDLQRFGTDEWSKSTRTYNVGTQTYTYQYEYTDKETGLIFAVDRVSSIPSGNPLSAGMTLTTSDNSSNPRVYLSAIDDNSNTTIRYRIESLLNGKVNIAFLENPEATGTDNPYKLKVNVLQGTLQHLINLNNSNLKVPIILLGGTVELYNVGTSGLYLIQQPTTIGENGPTLNITPDAYNNRSLTVNYNGSNTVQVTGKSTVNTGKVTLNIGNFTYTFNCSSTITDSKYTYGKTLYMYKFNNDETKYYFSLSSASDSNTFTYNDDGTTETYEIIEKADKTASSISIVNDNAGNLYLSNLDQDEHFTITKNDKTVTYTMGKTRLFAQYTDETTGKTTTKRWTGDIPITSSTPIDRALLDFDDPSSFIGDIITIGQGTSVLDFTNESINSQLNEMVDGERRLIVNTDNDDDGYGALVKVDNTHFKISYSVDPGTENKVLSAITMQKGITVEIDKRFTDFSITVADVTSLKSLSATDTETASVFSVMADSNGVASVYGSNSISLTNGTIKTDDSEQTIQSSNYTISGYGDGNNTLDGITFSAAGVIGKLDAGEFFTVDKKDDYTSNYTLFGAGLLEHTTEKINEIEQEVYRLHSTIKPAEGRIGVDVSLSTIDKGALVIVPTVVSSNKILEIGQTNSLDAVVFDNQINVNEGYAELKTATDGFTLSTLDGAANFSVGVDIISLTSDKSTTIYTDLVKDGHATIHTSDSKTTFKVTASGTSDTFTVTSGIADNPKIENATEITLLTGSITATKGQTIKLGNSASAKSITFTDDSADMLVTYNSSDSTFTVSTPTTTGGTAGGEFTFNNNTYKVDGGNGEAKLVFKVDKPEELEKLM